MKNNSTEVVIIGAGAAGMMCAAQAGQRGAKVVLVDHARRLAEKIRISGGGRCNFTNRDVSHQNFVSNNPQFARSALSRYTPQDFLELLKIYKIKWHEKHKGQLFCDESSEAIIHVLKQECDRAEVAWRMPATVQEIVATDQGYDVCFDDEVLSCSQLVIATGGLSIAPIGASDFGFRVAKQFGLKLVETRPALVPLTFPAQDWQMFIDLAGIALDVTIQTSGDKIVFREDLLFTHRGLSGPAVLQISSYWKPGDHLVINLLPELDLEQALLAQKKGNKQQLLTVLMQFMPKRLAEVWLQVDVAQIGTQWAQQRIADIPDKVLMQLAHSLQAWTMTPSGTEGYKKAEVTRGGVDTRELNQKTMASRTHPNLYFIGEVVDMTGWLGGYNFQWAWSSAVACAQALTDGVDRK